MNQAPCVLLHPPRPSYRAFRVHQQQVFGNSIVHACQYVGPWVGSALTNEKVPVIFQKFFSIAATHFTVVPHLALQLLLSPEGQRAHEQRARVVHGCCLVKTGYLGLGLSLRQRLGLGLDCIFEGLWHDEDSAKR